MAEDVKRPVGLRARGKRFWDAVCAEYDLSGIELELLAELCRTLDELDLLSRVLRKDGVSASGSKGQLRMHPALIELRSSRLVVSRLAAQLDLPDDDGAAVRSATSLRASKAANDRWAGVRQIRGSHGPA